MERKIKLRLLRKALKAYEYSYRLAFGENYYDVVCESRENGTDLGLCYYFCAVHGIKADKVFNVGALTRIINGQALIEILPRTNQYKPICFEKRIKALKKAIYCIEHSDGLKFLSKKAAEILYVSDVESANELIKRVTYVS